MTQSNHITKTNDPPLTAEEAHSIAGEAEDNIISLKGFLYALRLMADGVPNTDTGEALHTMASAMEAELFSIEKARERIWRGFHPQRPALVPTSEAKLRKPVGRK